MQTGEALNWHCFLVFDEVSVMLSEEVQRVCYLELREPRKGQNFGRYSIELLIV